MANPQPLFALTTDDLLNERVDLSMTNEDPDYPTENLLDDDPATVTKSTTTTTTITLDFNLGFIGAPVAVAVALINTNAVTASITGGSATTPIVMPGLEYGYGDRLNPWMRLTSTMPDLTWDLTLTRPSEIVWIGRIVLLTALHPFNAPLWPRARHAAPRAHHDHDAPRQPHPLRPGDPAAHRDRRRPARRR